MGDVHYMISEAAKHVGVESHVLRYWEEELDLPIGRTEMGHRHYTEEDIQLFSCIKELKEQGLLLKEIKQLLPDMLRTKALLKARKSDAPKAAASINEVADPQDPALSVYTADSAAALKSALTAAKAVLDKSNASITEMDSAVSALVDAVNNLAYGVQKTHLNVAIVAADKLLERAADYENTEDLTAALTAAKAVYANTSATQTEVDRAASTLLDALAAMAERADLAALKKLVASAGGLEEKDFTSDSYKDLKDAMDAAKDVIDDLNRTPEAIGKAYADIITAITNLERVGNKAALVAVIAKAEAIVAAKDSYVSSTLNGLEEALAAGKAVNDNPNALQDAINNAVTLLTEKVANVRLLGDVNNDGSVTTADSALLLRSAAELDTLDDAATVSADMNQDGIADTSDAVLILQTAAEF